MSAFFCYVTAGSRAEALAIARAVVAERLAASANVLDGAISIYWWRGALEEASEAVLVLKTRTELVERLTAPSASCTATSARAWSRCRSLPATLSTSPGSPAKPGPRDHPRCCVTGRRDRPP
jgi:uncharacterized protein involved in tolerance to divalent cations